MKVDEQLSNLMTNLAEVKMTHEQFEHACEVNFEHCRRDDNWLCVMCVVLAFLLVAPNEMLKVLCVTKNIHLVMEFVCLINVANNTLAAPQANVAVTMVGDRCRSHHGRRPMSLSPWLEAFVAGTMVGGLCRDHHGWRPVSRSPWLEAGVAVTMIGGLCRCHHGWRPVSLSPWLDSYFAVTIFGGLYRSHHGWRPMWRSP